MIPRHAAFVLQLDRLEVFQCVPPLALGLHSSPCRGTGAVVGPTVFSSLARRWLLLLARRLPAHGRVRRRRVRCRHGLVVGGVPPLRLPHDNPVVVILVESAAIFRHGRDGHGISPQQRLQPRTLGVSERFGSLPTRLYAHVSSLDWPVWRRRGLSNGYNVGVQTLLAKMLVTLSRMLSTG